MVLRRFFAALCVCSVSLVSLSAWVGCAPAYEMPAPAVDGQYLVHVVHTPDETIKELATWYTGSAKNLAAIKAANPAIGTGALRIGRRVNIPLELVVKTYPPEKVAPTPTPTKLIVIPEKQPPSGGEVAGQKDELANLDDLDKFEEEVGPLEGKDSDSMNLGAVPSVRGQSATLGGGQAVSQPDAAQPSSVVPAAPAASLAAPAAPLASPAARSNVDQFESQVDQLLMKEQAELDKLQKELSAGQPAAAPPGTGVER